MDSEKNKPARNDQETKVPGRAPGYYGQGHYGDYASAGYGYGNYGYGAERQGRGLNDYMLILRERIWYIVVVFLVVFSSAVVYSFGQTKIYRSTASVQIFRRDPMIMQVQAVVDNEIRSAEDLNTQVKVLESAAIVGKVAERITGEDLRHFMAPYLKGGADDPVTPAEILGANRRILPQRLSLIVAVEFEHPDRLIAAKVANLFIDEYITYNARVRIDESMKAVEDLKARAEDQRKRVEEIAMKLQEYREKNNSISLDQRKDIVTEKLRFLSMQATQTGMLLREAEIRWNQVKERVTKGGDLAELPFISSQPIIQTLIQQLAMLNIQKKQFSERYRDKHPKMVEIRNSIAQVEQEMQRATESASASIESQYQTALHNDTEARAALVRQENESLALDRYAVEYSNLERDLKINDQILQTIMERTRETSMTSTIESQNARVIDRAAPGLKPVKPNFVINLGLGLFGGLGIGMAFAFFVAFIDDRVKSSFDIETVVGLPLLGIIPLVKKMNRSEKAQIVLNNADRQVAESFLTLHASLQLKDESKAAKCLLVTSTIPGEGKSFLSTNLALTFAAHGEKVVVVDCDLRKPTVHLSLGVGNHKGIIDYCTNKATLDEVLIKNVRTNLDIVTSGGRAKNPTHVLNSKEFERLIVELRGKYDRVIFDTPPLAAVSDALIVLPLVDGSVFTIYFNKVRRKAAQFAAKRLLETNVPNFGAVLNGLNIASSGYYYAQYYDKSYKDYYVVRSKTEESEMR